MHLKNEIRYLQHLFMVAFFLVFSIGCEVDNYMDPSKTGYFEFAPTTMPILERIDVIQITEKPFAEISQPVPEDLFPGSLEYRLRAGDVVQCQIYDLVAADQMDVSLCIVDQAGNIRLPTLGDVSAAGFTLAGLENEIADRLKGSITDPLITVTLQSGQSFEFTIYGVVNGTGVYSIPRPDYRVMDGLAMAGGTLATTENIYVIREIPLNERVNSDFKNRKQGDGSASASSSSSPRPNKSTPATAPSATDLNSLIDQLDDSGAPGRSGTPGMVRQDDDPLLDLNGLDRPSGPASSDGDERSGRSYRSPAEFKGGSTSGYRFDQKREVWVPVGGGQQDVEMMLPVDDASTQSRSYATRVIQIDYQRLARGDSELNVVIRPEDRIYVEPPTEGNVYIGGEINRPGVFTLPRAGRLTLSRLISAAGGFGPIAIPSRVDLIRKIGPNRETAIRVNLSAIRNRSEPDIYMQPDDHVIIGTNFWATPLAVVRNGFRASYGFGFLLDRNFGNDVFGPPPTNIGNFN
jgi:polysaccharide export outer membrane protein